MWSWAAARDASPWAPPLRSPTCCSWQWRWCPTRWWSPWSAAPPRGLRNVRFIDANANILPEFFAPGEVDHIYINFCDPWPTKRHAKRRLTHGNFLKLYRKVLKDGGQIHFKTDNAPLFAWSVEEIPQFGFTLSEVTDDLRANGAVGVMTDYEAKFHELGTPIHRLVATMTPWEEPEEE